MWDYCVMGISFGEIFYCFFIFSVFGWIYESIYVSIRQKSWTNRGFLNGPIIPIYGCGATFIYIIFYNKFIKSIIEASTIHNIILVFFTGMLAASMLEYITSYFMEKFFHAKWWDYSDYPYNIKGRICVRASLLWGILSVIMTWIFVPYILDQWLQKVQGLQGSIGIVLALFLSCIFLIDVIITINATLELTKKLALMQKRREELFEHAIGVKWHEIKEEVRYKLNNNHTIGFVEEIQEFVDKRYEWILTKTKKIEEVDKVSQKTILLQEVEQRIKEFSAKIKEEKQSFLQAKIHRRMLSAFPNMKVRNQNGVLQDYKKKLRIKELKKHLDRRK